MLNRLRKLLKPVTGTRLTRLSSVSEIQDFWDGHYRQGRTSGAGSYGDLADFKGRVVNDLMTKFAIKSVLDLGCGDGNQLQYFNFSDVDYLGMDIAPSAIAMCRTLYPNSNFRFEKWNEDENEIPRYFDLSMSLDVIYHLCDDSTYFTYLDTLFNNSRYSLIYSINYDTPKWDGHVRPRKFTTDVEARYPQSKLLLQIENEFPDQAQEAFYLFENTRR